MKNLHSLEDWLSLLEKRHPVTIDLGLHRCGEVYRKLGSPRPGKTVFTVAGTNGKGSTVSYLASLAAASGFRYGTYTSPHILRFNERITVMGEAVSDDVIIDAFEQVEAARDDISLSYFEFSTLAGFLVLHQAGLDCAVLEVGLGGRLDTVNLVDTDCAVITPIGLDHQDYLGPDIESIAAEKAGIMRAGVPVICTQQNPPEAILKKARQLDSTLLVRGRDFQIQLEESGRLRFSSQNQTMQLSPPALVGGHQLDNLAAALAAFTQIFPAAFSQADELSEAIRNCQLPGRLQRFGAAPGVYVDVGHNPLAAEAVAAYFKDQQISRIVCVLAMLADKDAESVALALSDVCADWFCSTSAGERGQSAQALAQRLQKVLPDSRVNASAEFDAAMAGAQQLAADRLPILVFGSFTTASAFLSWWQKTHAAKLS